MSDKELRKLIGSRARARRMELNLGQQYVAEYMDVNKSTIQRYESGTIDNTKKLILEGLAGALHVSVEWLKGETDEYESDISDKKELQIRDVMSDILDSFPLDMKDADFSKSLLLLLLNEYKEFNKGFDKATKDYTKGNAKLAKTVGFDSGKEFNEIMFLRELTPHINMFADISDIIRTYSKNPDAAKSRLTNLLSDFSD